MNNPFDFFNKIYCINLPKSEERYKFMKEQFVKINILQRVEMIWVEQPPSDIDVPLLKRHPQGELGCALSHIKAIVHAIEMDVDNVLILEDDATFTEDCLERLSKAISELPYDWDIFYLGGNPLGQLNKISPNIAKISTGFSGTYGYCVSKKALLKLYDYSMDNLLLKPYDYSTKWLSMEGNGYSIAPYVCIPGKLQTKSIIKSPKAGKGGSTVIIDRWNKFLK